MNSDWRTGWRYLLFTPLLLWQAVRVRRRTLRLPAARSRDGCTGPCDGALRLVGIGDSIIAGIGVESHARSLIGRTAARLHDATGRPVAFVAHGFSGLTLRGAIERVLPQAPAADVYLISAGVNDAIERTSGPSFASDLREITTALRARSPQCRIVFAGIPPFSSFPALPWPLSAYLEQRGRTLQSAAQFTAHELAITCYEFPDRIDPVDFARDGFHPGPAGCDRWAQAIVQLLVERRTEHER